MTSSPTPKRKPILIYIGLIIIGVIVFARHPIQQAATAWAVLRSDAPSADAVASLVDQSSDPIHMLRRLWNTQRIPHRQYAMAYVRRRAYDDPEFHQAVRPLIQEAAFSVDVEVVGAALGLARSTNDGDLLRWAPRRLDDVDPDVRLLWMQYVHQVGDGRFTPIVARLLDDEEPIVAGIAAMALRDWTGQDIKPATLSDEQDLRRMLGQWKAWWREHQGEFVNDAPVAKRSLSKQAIPSVDFQMMDFDQKDVRLSDFRGKAVLLNFWATWCTSCAQEIPDLIELHARRGDQVTIIGVSVDLQTHDGHDHGQAESTDAIIDEVRVYRDQQNINYSILFDRSGEGAKAYSAFGLPVNVLIDADGQVHRRFVGGRPVEALERMIDELD